jgi:hypothetical protein
MVPIQENQPAVDRNEHQQGKPSRALKGFRWAGRPAPPFSPGGFQPS